MPILRTERKSKSDVINISGTMEEFGARKHWMDDRRLVWHEIVQIGKDRKRGDLLAAERFAKAQFKNLYGDWPRWNFSDAPIVIPRTVVVNKVKQQVISYAKSKRRL